MAFATLALADLAEMKGNPDRALALYQSLSSKDVDGLSTKVDGLAKQLSRSLLESAFKDFQARRQDQSKATKQEVENAKQQTPPKQ